MSLVRPAAVIASHPFYCSCCPLQSNLALLSIYFNAVPHAVRRDNKELVLKKKPDLSSAWVARFMVFGAMANQVPPSSSASSTNPFGGVAPELPPLNLKEAPVSEGGSNGKKRRVCVANTASTPAFSVNNGGGFATNLPVAHNQVHTTAPSAIGNPVAGFASAPSTTMLGRPCPTNSGKQEIVAGFGPTAFISEKITPIPEDAPLDMNVPPAGPDGKAAFGVLSNTNTSFDFGSFGKPSNGSEPTSDTSNSAHSAGGTSLTKSSKRRAARQF